MADERMGFAMVGCGEISEAHAKAFQESQKAKLVVCVDPNPAAAEDFGKRWGVEWTTEYDKALGRKDVAAVSIAAPHFLHEPLAIQAAKAGKHVLVEKPIACTLEQADRMKAACDKAKVALITAFVGLYTRQMSRARELIAAGALGPVVYVRMDFVFKRDQAYWQHGVSGKARATDWRAYKAKAGGGLLIMNLIHHIDQYRYVMNSHVQRIYAEYRSLTPGVEVEEAIMVSCRYENGALGVIQAAGCVEGGRENVLAIYGVEGQLRFTPLKVYVTKEAEGLTAGQWNEIKFEGGANARAAHADAMVDHIREGQPHLCGFKESRMALEFIEGAYRSMAEGKAQVMPLKAKGAGKAKK